MRKLVLFCHRNRALCSPRCKHAHTNADGQTFSRKFCLGNWEPLTNMANFTESIRTWNEKKENTRWLQINKSFINIVSIPPSWRHEWMNCENMKCQQTRDVMSRSPHTEAAIWGMGRSRFNYVRGLFKSPKFAKDEKILTQAAASLGLYSSWREATCLYIFLHAWMFWLYFHCTPFHMWLKSMSDH